MIQGVFWEGVSSNLKALEAAEKFMDEQLLQKYSTRVMRMNILDGLGPLSNVPVQGENNEFMPPWLRWESETAFETQSDDETDDE